MSGNIKGIGGLLQSGQTSLTGARETRAGPAATGGTHGKSVDKIDVSGIAVSLQKLDDYISKLPFVNNEKVVTIREKLAGDRYQIDGMRLATNFLRFELSYHHLGVNDGFHAIA